MLIRREKGGKRYSFSLKRTKENKKAHHNVALLEAIKNRDNDAIRELLKAAPKDPFGFADFEVYDNTTTEDLINQHNKSYFEVVESTLFKSAPTRLFQPKLAVPPVQSTSIASSGSKISQLEQLCKSAIKGDIETLNAIIIKKTIDVNTATEPNRQTALHFSAMEGNAEVVRLLVTAKASVNAKDEFYRTPLHYAAIRGSVKCTSYLLQNGARINEMDERSMCPLHFASREGHVELVAVLCRNGADVVRKDDLGETPLHFAVSFANIQVVATLLILGAPVDALDCEGNSALHIAARRGQMDIAKLLLSYNANINAVTESNLTPLHFAAIADRTEMTRFLTKKKADATIKDEGGRTAAELAISKEARDLITSRKMEQQQKLTKRETTFLRANNKRLHATQIPKQAGEFTEGENSNCVQKKKAKGLKTFKKILTLKKKGKVVISGPDSNRYICSEAPRPITSSRIHQLDQPGSVNYRARFTRSHSWDSSTDILQHSKKETMKAATLKFTKKNDTTITSLLQEFSSKTISRSTGSEVRKRRMTERPILTQLQPPVETSDYKKISASENFTQIFRKPPIEIKTRTKHSASNPEAESRRLPMLTHQDTHSSLLRALQESSHPIIKRKNKPIQNAMIDIKKVSKHKAKTKTGKSKNTKHSPKSSNSNSNSSGNSNSNSNGNSSPRIVTHAAPKNSSPRRVNLAHTSPSSKPINAHESLIPMSASSPVVPVSSNLAEVAQEKETGEIYAETPRINVPKRPRRKSDAKSYVATNQNVVVTRKRSNSLEIERKVINTPSITALKEKQVVKGNLQVFSQLGTKSNTLKEFLGFPTLTSPTRLGSTT